MKKEKTKRVEPTPVTHADFLVLVVGPEGTDRDDIVKSIQAAGLRVVASGSPRVREYTADLVVQGVAK